jgi:thiosulfate/3-mercaptopyruvate sulfurtransferase
MLLPLPVALALALGAPWHPAPAAAPADTQPMVVTTAWLAERLGRPDLVLFEIGQHPKYDAGHIPGAQWLDLHEISAPMDMRPGARDTGLTLELPAPARLDSALRAKGVSDRSHIVLYWHDEYMTPTARAWLTLAWAGLRGRVSILDGGLPAWRAEERAVTTAVPAVARGSFTTRPTPNLVVSAAWVRAHLRDPHVALIDARDREFYIDSVDNHMPRGGHIPGAVNLPFTSFTDSVGRLKPVAELRTLYRAAGAKPGDVVVTYCHIGQQGSWARFVAEYLGYDARLYDGSFEEWSARADLPVEGQRRASR